MSDQLSPPAPTGSPVPYRATPRRDVVSRALARDRLGAVAITFLMLAAAAPFVVIAGAISQAYGVSGVTAVPVAFLVVAVLLVAFVPGYLAMSRRITNAGSFYAYIARSLGKPAGVAAGLVALVAYNALQIALFGGFGVWVAQLLTAGGVPVPWWMCALFAWCVVGVLGVLRIDFNGKVLAGLMVAEVAVIAVLDVVFAMHPAEGGVSFDTLSPAELLVPGAAAVLVTAVTGYVGFEQATIYAEESRDPPADAAPVLRRPRTPRAASGSGGGRRRRDRGSDRRDRVVQQR
ncbi:MAG: hypothetical protein ACRDT4_07305 [Micromonosporaceae bacterium]